MLSHRAYASVPLSILLAIAVEYGLFTIPQHLAVPTGWAVMIIVHADAVAGAWSEGKSDKCSNPWKDKYVI